MRDFHVPGRSPALATEGMCASSHPLGVLAAVDILKRGGNAMDAAIAGAVLLGICEPQMSGIGGDCFVLYSPPGTDDVKALNGSGRAPAAASAEALRAAGQDKIGLRSIDSVTVPGAMDALCHLSESVGKLGIDAVLAPAIHYAENGVPVSPRVAFDWKTQATALQGDAALRYFLNDGRIPEVGDMFHAKAQAEALRRVAKQGRDGFYTGEVAEDMVASLQAMGGTHTMDDFANTRFTQTVPISSSYKDVELVEHPPNGHGATANLLLNILSHFDIAGMDPFGAARAHIEAEATKLAYDARNRFLGDADYTTRLDHMLSMDTAAALAALIDPKKAMAAAAPLSEAVHKDTTYITVVDKDRMVVSLIYSIYHGFGSGIVSDKFGVLFHNRGAGFNLEKGHPNELGGGKRPLHTIIPAILKQNGRVLMPFGVMGGAYQPNGHARVVTNMVDFGMDPQSAIDAPRSFSDVGDMSVEGGYSDIVRQELTEMGHSVSRPVTPIGGAQAIRIRDNGVLEGASDQRKDGLALGY